MKLIDADAIKEKLYEYHTRDTDDLIRRDLCRSDLDVVLLLDNAPEGIIRCKNCKYYRKLQPHYEDWCSNEDVGVMDVEPEFFCAKAERRTE